MTFEEQIALLVRQASPKQMYYLKGTGSLDPAAYVKSIGPGTYVASDRDEILLTSEPAQLLQQLYAGAGPDDRRAFAPTLLKLLNEVNARVIREDFGCNRIRTRP